MDRESEDQRIVQAATRLFAALGFDGTTTEMIAEAAGVNHAAVRRAFPGNVDLYREVMRQAALTEEEALAGATAAFTPTRQWFESFLDELLDFNAQHRETMGLWLQRVAGDAADTADLGDRYFRPRLTWFVNALRDAVPDPTQLEYMLMTFPWVIYGFLGNSLVGGEDVPRGPEIEAFRSYLHLLARRVLALPESPGGVLPG